MTKVDGNERKNGGDDMGSNGNDKEEMGMTKVETIEKKRKDNNDNMNNINLIKK